MSSRSCSTRDVSEHNAPPFPTLYRELQKRRFLSIKTFTMWVWKAVYQGGAIMLLAIVLFEKRFVHVVAIDEHTARGSRVLLMVANEVTTSIFEGALAARRKWSTSRALVAVSSRTSKEGVFA